MLVKAASNNQVDDIVDQARTVWRPRVGRDLAPGEVKQITANVTGFFAVLAEWARKQEREALRNATSESGEARDER